MQLHVEMGDAALYSKNGTDCTRRFRGLKSTIETIAAKNAIIDCEHVACDVSGMPNFRTLMELGNNAPALCLWCFDLIALNGVLLTPMLLFQRKTFLAEATDDEHLQFSGDPAKLLQVCHKMGLEGIIWKRKESPYRSGPTRDWRKIKTASWKVANRNRAELFEKRR
jgi:bifunctional non-homologous end joining protein LigD